MRRAAAGGALALILSTATAWADNATEAKHRFDRGFELMSAGRCEAAVGELLVSNRLSPNPAAAYNIATCFHKLGKFDEAYSAIQDYLAFDLSDEERHGGEALLEALLPRIARIAIASTPPGAAIYLDQKNLGQYGTTPRRVPASPRRGSKNAPFEVTVILTRAGHHEARRTVTVERGKMVMVDVTLEPLTGRLAVTSSPDGAEVSSGPRVLGTTPLEVELPIGAYQLTVAHHDHAPAERTVEIRARETAQVRFALDALPEPTGRVRILTNVGSGLVRVDGAEAGFTPLVLELPRGPHQVKVEKLSYRTWEEEVTVDPTRLVAAEVTLEPEAQGKSWSPVPWIALGGTSAAAIVTVVLGLQALQAKDDFVALGTRDAYDTASQWALSTDVMIGVSIAGAVATTALFLFSGTEEDRSSSAVIERQEAP